MHILLAPLVALASGDLGSDVASLHAVLARLDLAANIPPDELATQRLGPGTVKAVQRLFAQAGLGDNPTGAIDARAAAKLNDFLVSRRLLAEVSGTAADQAGAPASGYRITVHDVRNLDGAAAAEVKTDADGHWQGFYDPTFYVEARPGVIARTDAIVLVVRAFGPDGVQAARSEPTPNPNGQVRMNLVVQGAAQPAPAEGQLRVRGWLESGAGARLPGWKVEVFDRDIGPVTPDQRLGATPDGIGADARGGFNFIYDVATVAPGDAPPPVADLVFHITDPNGRAVEAFQLLRQPVANDLSITVEQPFPAEKLALGVPARRDEFVRIVLASAPPPAGPSEFDQLLAALRPLLGDRTPAVMDEAANRDVSFAAQEVGQDFGKLTDLVGAFRLSNGMMQGVGPSALYALARTLNLRDPAAIAARATEDLAAALKGAVPGLIADLGQVPGVLAAAVKRQAADATLNTPASGDAGTLAQIIAPHLADPADRAALLTAFADHPGTPPQFWTDYAASHPEKPVAALQMSLQLAGATGANAPLVAAIRSAHPQARSLRGLVLEMDGAKLSALMDQAAAPVPDADPTLEPAVARQQYATAVAGVLDAAHPTAAVARLAKGWAVDHPQALSTDGAQLLERVVLNTDYELGSGGMAELAQTHADVLFAGQNDPAIRARALADAQRVERLYNISSGPQTLAMLATTTGPGAKLFKGAFDIARLGKQAFLANFAGQPAETLQALSRVHETAAVTAEATASLMMGALQQAQDPAIAATKPTGNGKPIPAWAQLFGTDRLTDCEECRALNGAAAYLVQILEFLDHRCAPNADGVTPLDVLIGNAAKGVEGIRPDLAHIKLSCENTNTTLPAIDLINEILEACIVFKTPLATPPNEPAPGVTADELAAEPEHIQAKAYESLAGAVFPINLPFDLSAASARPYLENAKTSRAEVIQLFSAASPDALAAERLGLADLDWAILTGALPGATAPAPAFEVPRLFDLEPAAPGPVVTWSQRLDPQVLKAAKLLGLTVRELLALAATRFVSGDWPEAERTLLERFPLDIATFKTLRDAGFAAPAADVQAVLDWLEVPLADLQAWSDRNLARQARTIVADPINANKLELMRLVHLDGSPLAEADWLRLHRMARLARRSGLAIADLDLALAVLGGGGDLDAARLTKLGVFLQLGKDLALEIPTLAALFGGLETGGLYEKLFIRSGILRTDAAFAPTATGERLPAAAGILLSDHVATLASAFDAQPADVVAVANARGLTALAMDEVSKIWREVRLAKALSLEVADLVQLQAALAVPAFAADGDPAATAEFVARAREIKATLASALAFTGLRPDPDDAAAVEAALRAITASLAALADQTSPTANREGEKRRAVLEAIATPLAADPVLLALFVTDEAPPGVRKALLRSAAEPALDGLPAMDDDARRPVLAWVRRLLVLAKAFALTADDFAILGAAAALPDLSNLTAAPDPVALMRAWRKAVIYAGLRKGRQPALLALALAKLAGVDNPGRAQRVADAIAAARPPRRGETPAAAQAAQAALAADVLAILPLIPPAGLGATPQEDPITALAELDRRLAIVAATAAPAATLATLAAGSADPKAAGALEMLKRATQSRYDPLAWLGAAQHLNDPLRQLRRDALVAWWKHDQGLDTDQEVFTRLLLDPGANPVVRTSRIANAMTTVQYFVHATRLGFWNTAARPSKLKVEPSQINPEWELYLHSFRMTQANFEVLASPYLYMAPDLRDDKTPLFREIEGFLRQNGSHPETLTTACMMFVEKLGEIGHLEVCGTYLQEDFEAEEAMRFKGVLHVFGRTRSGTKRSYYYRRLNRYQNYEEWTPWEAVKLDIQGIERDRSTTRTTAKSEKPEAGVHLLPVVWKRKLHLFWPSLVRKIETSEDTPGINMKTGDSKSTPPQPYWELKLCWSRLEDGAWTPRQISSDYHETYAPISEAMLDA